MPGHTDTILAVRWGVDEEGREDGGRTLVSTSKDKTIRIWDMRAGRCVTIMKALTSTFTFTSTFTSTFYIYLPSIITQRVYKNIKISSSDDLLTLIVSICSSSASCISCTFAI